jgi:hypothetical protein
MAHGSTPMATSAHPSCLNWNWPPVNGSGQIDIENGWAEDIRNWAVITAAQNRVETAEQIAPAASVSSASSIRRTMPIPPSGPGTTSWAP